MVCDHLPTLHVLQHRKLVSLLRWSLHCSIHTVTGGTCENNWTPRFKKRRLHGELMQARGIKAQVFPKKSFEYLSLKVSLSVLGSTPES